MVDTPINLTYGTVTGKFLLTVLDSIDVDRYPDYVPASGTVTFTPSILVYKNLALPATFITSPVVCDIDMFGDLRDPNGGLGVVLVATDNPDLQPRDWTYIVTISASGHSASFPISVTGGATIDITSVSPAVSSAGTAVIVSSADRILAQAAAVTATEKAAAAAQSAIDAAAAVEGLDEEAVQDVVGTMTSGTGYVSVTYSDGAGTLVIGSTTALQTALDAKAPLVSPALTGNPTAPTPTAGDSDTSISTTAFVTGAITTSAATKANTTHTHVESDVTNLVTDLAAKAPLASPAFTGTPTGITKTHVGLGNVDNTADSAKPVSTAQQTAIDLKANAASPAFTGTPTGLTKAHVGLSNVDNTADTAKPVSTAQQTALDLKAPMTGVAGVRIKSGGTWPSRPTGYAVIVSIGADPSPVDQVAGDVRWIPA